MTDTRRNLLLWMVVIGAPAVWLLHFEAIFALAPWACIFQTKVTLYAVSALTLALEVFMAALAWGQWKALSAEHTGEGGATAPRARFMAMGGIVFGIGFAAVAFAQAIPELMLGACE